MLKSKAICEVAKKTCTQTKSKRIWDICIYVLNLFRKILFASFVIPQRYPVTAAAIVFLILIRLHRSAVESQRRRRFRAVSKRLHGSNGYSFDNTTSVVDILRRWFQRDAMNDQTVTHLDVGETSSINSDSLSLRCTERDSDSCWHEVLPYPRYEIEQLLSWKVLRWLLYRCLDGILGFGGEEGEIDRAMERLYLKKRWEIQDEAHVQRLVGNTPLIAIHLRYLGRKRVIYAKCEQCNMTGSIKDRMALHILQRAYQDGTIRRGDVIVEASSGNTGISLAAVGRALGHPVLIFMPDWMSPERRALIASYGAEVVPVSRLQGGFVGSIRMAESVAQRFARVFLPRQFCNPHNADAHESSTGPEILLQLAGRGLLPDAFVAGVGTGGTVVGVGRCLRRIRPEVRLHPVEPAESPTLSTGYQVGHHRIQGISDEFVPPVFRREEVDDPIPVPDGDAILMAQKLAATLGLGVGISSGANLLAALEAQDRLGPDSVVVTVLCDDSKKYLSTALARREPARPGYRTPHVELLRFEVVSPLAEPVAQRLRAGQWEADHAALMESAAALEASRRANRRTWRRPGPGVAKPAP